MLSNIKNLLKKPLTDIIEGLALGFVYTLIGFVVGVIWTTAQSLYYTKVGSSFYFISGYDVFLDRLDSAYRGLNGTLSIAIRGTVFIAPPFLLTILFGYFLSCKYVENKNYGFVKKHMLTFLTYFVLTIVIMDVLFRLAGFFVE